jgi:hypothetical protein
MKIEQLILMLLLSSILTFRVQFDDNDEKHKNPKVVARLNMDTEGNLCVTKDSHCDWHSSKGSSSINC